MYFAAPYKGSTILPPFPGDYICKLMQHILTNVNSLYGNFQSVDFGPQLINEMSEEKSDT